MLEIKLDTVESSQIHAIGYHPESRTLRIQFRQKSGPAAHFYDYANVEPEIFDGLKAADSVGKYFGSTIKGHYEFTKIEPAKVEG